MSISRRDHVAWVLSGLSDGDTSNPSRWTDPSFRYRFDLYPAPADFHAKFRVPDFVAKTGVRSLEVLVNGHALKTGDAAMLDKETQVSISNGVDAEVLVFDLAP